MLLKVIVGLLLLAGLELPALHYHSQWKSASATLATTKASLDNANQSIGTLKAQLATSQADLADSQAAVRASNLSIDQMKRDAENAAAAAASFALAMQAKQATYGSIIRQRDSQIASLKAQTGGCDEAIADLRSGQ
jgi:chromosome segregation ATPase